MRIQDYIEAVYRAIHDGMALDDVFLNLKRVLGNRGHLKHYARILNGLLEKMQKSERAQAPKIILAREKDHDRLKNTITEALKELACTTTPKIHIDQTIVGGFITTGNGKRVDHSYKTKLLHIYHNIAD